MLLLILAATLATKLVIVLWLIPQVADALPYSIGGFTDRYDNIARNLVAGNGYRLYPDTSETLLRTPGYVLVLAAIFYVFGDSLTAAQVVNILFGIASAYIVAHIAAKWVMPRGMGGAREDTVEWAPLAPAILFLYYPGIIFSETRGGSESLFILLLTAFIYYLYSCVHTNRTREFILAGIMLGLAMLVRSTPALIPLVFFPYSLFKARSSGKTWRSVTMNFAIMGITAFTILAPWGLRNYQLTGKFIVTSTIKGTAAHQGLYVNKNYESEKGRNQLLEDAVRVEDSLKDKLGLRYRKEFFSVFYIAEDEVKFDTYLSRLVTEEYLKSPELLIKNCILNFAGFWFRGQSASSMYLNITLTAPLLLMAGYGIYVGYKRRFDITPMLLAIGTFIIPHLPILGVARYHVPLIPFLAILVTIPFFRTPRRNQQCSKRTESSAVPEVTARQLVQQRGVAARPTI